MLLEYSFLGSWNLDTWENMSETPGNVWNVVLEKDGEEQRNAAVCLVIPSLKYVTVEMKIKFF
jgi:hypothetical protein